MRENKQVRQGMAGLLLILFSFYYANVCLFTHAHIIHGTTIVHSHIHLAHHHDTPSGQHTASTLELIASLNDFNALDVFCSSFDFSQRIVQCAEQAFDYTADVYYIVVTVGQLRAPPVCNFLF